MKVSFLLIILIIMAIPILMSFTNARIEKQKYRVIKKEKEFEGGARNLKKPDLEMQN